MESGKDITYCSNEKCKQIFCKRHRVNAPTEEDVLVWWSDFNTEGKDFCDWFLEL